MRVIGIDCGIAISGWSIVENAKKNNGYKVIDYGIIKTRAGWKITHRLKKLFECITEITKQYKPDFAAVESLFYFKNQKTIMSVGQARGVTLLALSNFGLDVFDYTPLQVKQAVVGYGKATKQQVQKMVKMLLKLKKIPKPDDAADALAVAICHINSKQ